VEHVINAENASHYDSEAEEVENWQGADDDDDDDEGDLPPPKRHCGPQS
jgi:hypothetical protein